MLRFGTDGVRGNADHDLTPTFVAALGRAIAHAFGGGTVLIGRDTRESGARIMTALAAGARLQGASPELLDILPTPAIAFAAQRRGVPAAIVSASHNPWPDNGVKVVGPDGRKLSDEQEAAIEAALEAIVDDPTRLAPAPTPTTSGSDAAVGPDDYVAHLLSALEGRTLSGLHVVVDCANGAAYDVGPRALRAAGAHVTVLHAEPDGRNINEGCGSTHPQSLQAEVRATGADLGLALDGDADRVVAVDEHGELVDGDQIMAMLALDFHARARLANGAIAVTVMSNLGLRRALTAAGIGVIETPVGDRHVVAAMERDGLVIGGEQSGHVVFSDFATTGDGLLTGLLVADLVVRSGASMSRHAARMTRLPQVLVNVRFRARVDLDRAPAVWSAVREAEATLGDRGRILLRSSGTEPLVRIMVEAPTEEEAVAVAERVREAVVGAFPG